MRELPIADFDFSESTVKNHGRGVNGLNLRLCKADFDFLLNRNFNTHIAIRNIAANRSHGRYESMADRIARIIDNQNGICSCTCDSCHKGNKHNSCILVKISDAVVNANKSLCRFKVEKA